ncbi:MAG: hypothetical protein II622_01245, partial [Thermoguttaceae bacterium]|nr:hypothetical protein [Thermoguttaceae bacterium]
MKKILALICAAVMLLSLAACGSKTDAEGSIVNPGEGKVFTVGICQLVQHPALDAATEGFKKALTEKLGDKVKFD